MLSETVPRPAGRRGQAPALAGPDVRWIFFTSGTSSAPKGVQHTDASVGYPALALANGLHLQPSDRSAVAFPIAHIGGVNWTIASLLSGCQLLLAERFHPGVIAYFDRRGITLPGVVTAQHLAYRDAARAARAENRPQLFAHARAYPGGGATKPPTLLGELQEVIGGVIVSGYGMTEHPMITMSSVDDPPDRLATTEGRPSPGVEVKIRDLDSGELCPTGQSGEIWVRGPHLFQGYLDAEATAAVMEDGFLRSGDLGRQDELGFITITGRAKDVIVRKGENISAKEVEDLLYTHPDIIDVAVVGLPDPQLGERCCAVVVLSSGADRPTVARLGAFLGERGLMKQKWPEQVEIADRLERNNAGKVLKAEIVRRLSSQVVTR
jgi:acyl-CoA synthetase (AMP-forming)/AMP-acid ligase II